MSSAKDELTPEMEALKAKLKATWMSGDFDKIAQIYAPGAAEFVARLALRQEGSPGQGLPTLILSAGAPSPIFRTRSSGRRVEGFVNQYISDSKSEDGKTLVFITESIENIPAGFKARETYRIVNDNEFTEVFELAEPGKAFEVYSETSFKRKGRP